MPFLQKGVCFFSSTLSSMHEAVFFSPSSSSTNTATKSPSSSYHLGSRVLFKNWNHVEEIAQVSPKNSFSGGISCSDGSMVSRFSESHQQGEKPAGAEVKHPMHRLQSVSAPKTRGR